MSSLKIWIFDRLYYCYAFILFIPHSLHAMTLDDAIKASLHHEGQLKLSELKVRQSIAILDQAKQRDGLKINLVSQLDYEKIETPPDVLFPKAGNRKGINTQIQLDYPIYTSGRHKLGIEVANKQLMAHSENLLNQKSETILNTVMVYTDVLKKQTVLNLRNQALKNLNRSSYEAQRRFDVGLITRSDLAQVTAQLSQGKADLTQAESELKISQTQFYQITGIIPKNLENIITLPTIPNNIDTILVKTIENPLIRQTVFEVQAAEKQFALSKRELWPTIILTSRLGKQNEANTIGSKSDNYMVGVQVNIPLYDDGLNRANIKKAEVDISIARQKLENIRIELNQRAQTSYSKLESIRQNKVALKNAIEAAQIALTYTQKEFELGTKATFDLLTAQQKLLDVQTQNAINNQDEVLLVYQLLDQMDRLNDKVMGLESKKEH